MMRVTTTPRSLGANSAARVRAILRLALPIIGGMVSQNILNIADTAMVGRIGAPALAAVGLGSVAAFLAMAFITGLSAGVQAMAARRLGQGKTHEAATPLNAGLLAALVVGIPWCAVLFVYAGEVFSLLLSDPEVARLGVPYFQWRIVGVVAVGANFAFRGYWNGVNRPGIYLRTLIVMHSANLVLNYGLIFGRLGMPELGVTGAGIGSAAATYIGTLTYLLLAFKNARSNGFLKRLPTRKGWRTLMRLSVPNGFQQLMFAASYATLFWIIGRVGTVQLAAANVLVNLWLVTMLPSMALGMAATSLVSQALGERNRVAARRWGWEVVRVALVGLVPLGLPLLIAPEAVLQVFTHDRQIIAAATLPLQIIGGSIALDAVGTVLMHALLGAGASGAAMRVSVALQWGFFLPAAYLVGPILQWGLTAIWAVQLTQRAAQAAAFAVLWRGTRWAEISV